eukprot:s5957_g2.t1
MLSLLLLLLSMLCLNSQHRHDLSKAQDHLEVFGEAAAASAKVGARTAGSPSWLEEMLFPISIVLLQTISERFPWQAQRRDLERWMLEYKSGQPKTVHGPVVRSSGEDKDL